MRELRSKLALMMVIGLAVAAPLRPARAAAPASARAAPAPSSAAAFDALFKRLEFGDLSVANHAQQHVALARLQRLAGARDGHRQRLLASARCALDYTNARQEGAAFAQQSLAAATAANDIGAMVRLYFCRGDMREYTATTQAALADYDHGIALAREHRKTLLIAQGQAMRGAVESYTGHLSAALQDLFDAHRTFVAQQLAIPANRVFSEIGAAYMRLGYFKKARQYLEVSVAGAQRVHDAETAYRSTMFLGFTASGEGDFQSALRLHQQALQRVKGSGQRKNIGLAELALAGDFNDLKQPQSALAALPRAQEQFVASGDAQDIGMVDYERGRALALQRQPDAALAAFAQAEAVFKRDGLLRYEERLLNAKAHSLADARQPAAALAAFQTYMQLHDRLQHQAMEQRAEWLAAQFNAERVQLQNDRLRSERRLQAQQVQSLLRARRWEQVALVLLTLLLALLAALGVYQFRRTARLKRAASLDELTGVANRRGILEFLDWALRRARSAGGTLAVLAMDVDHFKHVNDTHGHLAGDRLLHAIATGCRSTLRGADLFGRTGGEEFLAVLPDTSCAQAVPIAECIRAHVATLRPDPARPDFATVSIGVAALRATDTSAEALLARADAALYRAKASGRNRVGTAEDERTPPAGDGEIVTGPAA